MCGGGTRLRWLLGAGPLPRPTAETRRPFALALPLAASAIAARLRPIIAAEPPSALSLWRNPLFTERRGWYDAIERIESWCQ